MEIRVGEEVRMGSTLAYRSICTSDKKKQYTKKKGKRNEIRK